MASDQENCSYTITQIKSQNSSESREQENFLEQQHEKFSDGKSIEEFKCVMEKDVLAPAVLLSCIPLETELGFEQQVEGHRTESPRDGTQEFVRLKSPSTNAKTNKRKCTTEGNDGKISFELFKFINGGEQYILKIHEIQSSKVESYHLMLENKGGAKWSVGIYNDEGIEHPLYLMEEDSNPLIFCKKYNLPLSARLSGWTLENRKRAKGVVDKFYYHQKKQFRSLVEVAVFLLYSSKPKNLEPLTKMVTAQEPLEKEATTTMTMSSNVEASNTRTQRLDNGGLGVEDAGILGEALILHIDNTEEYSMESIFSSIAPPNESEGLQDALDGKKNKALDIEEEIPDFFDNVYEELEKRCDGTS